MNKDEMLEVFANKLVELWHGLPDVNVPLDVRLHEFMGLTKEQYASWVERRLIVDECDLRIDAFTCGNNNAVRVVHIPSGLVATCDTSKSQIENKKSAILDLRSRLWQKQ